MTVFVLWYANYDANGILGVFSSIKLAEEAREKYKEFYGNWMSIEEFSLDQLHV